MDSLAALALATEMPKPHLLKRPPQQRDDFIVSRKMTKHIVYMSLYQFVIVCLFVFWGENLIPEPREDLRDPIDHPFVAPGREYEVNGEPLWQAKRLVNGNEYSRHITWIFHFFVFLQIWNMVCSRKIHDEFNVLEGISTNWTFLIIWVIILVLQFFIIAYGSVAFRLSPHGLSMIQHVEAVVVALSVFIVNAIIKCIPDKWAPQLGKDSVYDRKMALAQK